MRQVAKAWSEEARARLAETQVRLQDQLDKLTAQVDAHRFAISDRVDNASEALSTLKASSRPTWTTPALPPTPS